MTHVTNDSHTDMLQMTGSKVEKLKNQVQSYKLRDNSQSYKFFTENTLSTEQNSSAGNQ